MKCKQTIKVDGRYFNCGRCHACRINYTSAWTLRCLYELSMWDSASFVTLTYNDAHLPKDYGLDGKAPALFFKRLRKNLPKRKIKYYLCGEYGDTYGRPHYHAIIYGLDCYSDTDRQALADSWTLCDDFLFDKNHNGMLPVCREDIAYVCGYVQKKLNGSLAEEKYGDRLRPFSRVSNGIGLDFALKNQERLKNNGFTYLNKQKIAIPRYLRDKLGIVQSEIVSTELSVERLEKENAEIAKAFREDMQRRGTWYPDNLTMMTHRFERWYENAEFAFSKQIERDYLVKKSLQNGCLRYI
ncbi:replication initiator protein [Microvirus sp.]|nr:replication initiator protein [Microvirus sp.]